MYYNPESKETKTHRELQSFLNASIPQGTKEVAGWYLVNENQPMPDVDFAHKVIEGPIELIDGEYVATWIVEEKSEEEIAITRAKNFINLRRERERRLQDTDYMIMPDYPIDGNHLEILKTYRQALRDLPAEEGAPWDGGGEKTPWPELVF